MLVYQLALVSDKCFIVTIQIDKDFDHMYPGKGKCLLEK
jgi:hypothetical protein